MKPPLVSTPVPRACFFEMCSKAVVDRRLLSFPTAFRRCLHSKELSFFVVAISLRRVIPFHSWVVKALTPSSLLPTQTERPLHSTNPRLKASKSAHLLQRLLMRIEMAVTRAQKQTP